MSSTILKEENYKIDFRKRIDISKLVDLDWIKKLKNKSVNKNGLNIKKEGDFFIIKNSMIFNFEEDLSLSLKNKYVEYIMSLKNKETIYTTNEDELLKYVYLDIYFYLEMILEKINKKENYNELRKKLNTAINKQIGFNNVRNNKVKGHTWKRSELLQKNSTSIEWSKNSTFLISKETTELLKNSKIPLVEIPNNYDKDKLKEALHYINNLLNDLNIKKINFKLRFKKLKLYRKEGMFFKKNNTIILDPRHISTFKHELGHYVYENNLPITLNGKRLYKHNYAAIVKKLKKDNSLKEIYDKIHLLEDYEKESELFAYWFEKQ